VAVATRNCWRLWFAACAQRKYEFLFSVTPDGSSHTGGASLSAEVASFLTATDEGNGLSEGWMMTFVGIVDSQVTWAHKKTSPFLSKLAFR